MCDIAEKLVKIIDKENIFVDEPMKKHTSFKIGGVADYFINVQKAEQLRAILNLAKQEKIPFQIVGNGTNLLVREGGIRGFVVKLDLKDCTIDRKENEAIVTCGSGMALSQLSFIALENDLTGLEAMAGIPGTLGGAIRMNAGAYGSEMKDVVVCSKCMDLAGNIKQVDFAEHEFSYRKSAFEENNLILLETTLKLGVGKKQEIQTKMQAYKNLRIQKQPLEFPNAGSIFKRKGDILIAKLIDECGLKGYCVGDAQVSTKHSGFIINKGNATARDVLELIYVIEQNVKQKFKVDVELEIIVIGEE